MLVGPAHVLRQENASSSQSTASLLPGVATLVVPRRVKQVDDRRIAVMSSAHSVEIAGAMVRCIVAAETYRVSGQLPEWARRAG